MIGLRTAIGWVCAGVLTLTFDLAGCNSRNETLWSREVDSPKHHYQVFAAARVEGAGFGTDSATTEVAIQQNHDARTRSVILDLASGKPVSVAWTDNTHLRIGYRPEDVEEFDFQAIRCCGVDIALTPLPPGSPKPQ